MQLACIFSRRVNNPTDCSRYFTSPRGALTRHVPRYWECATTLSGYSIPRGRQATLRDVSRKSRRIRFSVCGCAFTENRDKEKIKKKERRERKIKTIKERKKKRECERKPEVIKADRTRKKPAPFSLLLFCLHPSCFCSPLSFPLLFPSLSLFLFILSSFPFLPLPLRSAWMTKTLSGFATHRTVTNARLQLWLLGSRSGSSRRRNGHVSLCNNCV